MALVQIRSKNSTSSATAITEYQGFRLFFIGASAFSALSMFLWLLILNGYLTPHLTKISASQWHAHEMIYGYTVAVVTGFLLTAAENWTGRETLRG